MSDDIVARLRAEGENAMRQHLSLGMHKLCNDAADEIERLRATINSAYILNEADWDAFVATLDSPPPPNAKLKALLRRQPIWTA
jgi:uncharacterized protein (DUF1778 family)